VSQAQVSVAKGLQNCGVLWEALEHLVQVLEDMHQVLLRAD
jgi:hypothetical protein